MLAQQGLSGACRTVIEYACRVIGAQDPRELLAVLPADAHPEIEGLVMTLAEKLIQEGMVRGQAEGRVRSLRSVLERVLLAKFGAIPDPVLERIRSADADLLDAWFDRALVATSFEQVFSGEEHAPERP